jgi:predicted ATPase/DNA-binding winged helix-turn-helix (wHTH) protein
MPDFPPFRLDPSNQCLWRLQETAQDERILLPPKAFAVLRYLVEHAGRLVTQEELLEAVWPETYIKPEVLKSRIFEIRSALGDRPQTPRFIETLPRRGYRFIAPVHDSPAAAPALPGPPASGLLVGRAGALETLGAWLHRALQGQRQLVLVTGEPGIGKTALVDAFQQQALAAVPSLHLARGQCLEGYGGMEAYYPMLEALGQMCREAGGAAVIETLATHAPTWLVQFPALMTRAHRDRLQRELQGTTRERMLREIAELLEALTADRPLLLVLEDLQWVDPATVDLLAALARRRAPARLLLVGTYRPGDLAVGQPPLQVLTQDLRVHQLCHELAVAPLSDADVAAYLAAVAAGARLPEGLAALVSRHAEGNPLFMRALLEHLTQQGLLAREADGWCFRVPMPIAARDLGVPEDLRQMIETQLARLRPEAQRVLEVASVTGVAFTASVSAAAADLEADDFDAVCDTLARRQHLVRPAGAQPFPDGSVSPRYAFVHALYREVCYGRQAPGRRATLHRRLGAHLEAVFATQLQDVAAELAYHFEAGAEWVRAIQYLRVVADTAAQRYAYREAATTLQHALALVPHLPETPERTQHALPLYIALGAALQVTKGQAAPEVEHAYIQAYALCQQVGETPELVPVLYGLWRLYGARPQLRTARELGETLLRLAQPADDPALAVIAHCALGLTWFWLGALPAARTHLEEGIARYTPDQCRAPVFRIGQNPGVSCRVYAAYTFWLLGYPEQAMARLHETLALAHELSHPFSLAYAQVATTFVLQFCRDVLAVHEQAEAAVALATERGFPAWAAIGMSFRGWALAMQGQGEEGMAQIRQGIASLRATGAALFVPYMCTLLADVAAHWGHPADGLQALTEAHTLVEQREERWWEAEVCRLWGVVLLCQPRPPQAEAEAWLQRALDVARHQEAKALELRAAMSLARLWQQQGKRVEARQLLAPLYGWFTEGFDTADLQEATALLHELGG